MAGSLVARNVVALGIVAGLLVIAILITMRSHDESGFIVGLVMVGTSLAWIGLLVRRLVALRRAVPR
jgi:hypothetical protein